jgi:hypothetical protein
MIVGVTVPVAACACLRHHWMTHHFAPHTTTHRLWVLTRPLQIVFAHKSTLTAPKLAQKSSEKSKTRTNYSDGARMTSCLWIRRRPSNCMDCPRPHRLACRCRWIDDNNQLDLKIRHRRPDCPDPAVYGRKSRWERSFWEMWNIRPAYRLLRKDTMWLQRN